jgi:hypothetical protein
VRTDSMVAFAVIVLAAVWAASYIFVAHRERACAEHCRVTGHAGYEYQSFSGSGRFTLRGDSCKCSNITTLVPPANP